MIVVFDSDGGGSHKGSPAGWGWVAGIDGREVAYGSGGMPPGTTNNVAEYTGMIMAITHAIAADWGSRPRFIFETDSLIVVQQVKGDFAVKSLHLLPLRDEARRLLSALDHELRWHKRVNHSRADALATQGRENYNKQRHSKLWPRS